jgi:hypothetical protein
MKKLLTISLLLSLSLFAFSQSNGIVRSTTPIKTKTGNTTLPSGKTTAASPFAKQSNKGAVTSKHPVYLVKENKGIENVYSGNAETDNEGLALVLLPSNFESENTDFKYQLTVVGKTFAQAIVYEEIKGNSFIIKTNAPNIKVSWHITGIRNDPFAFNHQ